MDKLVVLDPGDALLLKLKSYLVVLSFFASSEAIAQPIVDIIRGRVVTPDGQPVAGVLVTALSFIGGIEKQKRTNGDGRYTIVYTSGEGNYWVQFNAVGYGSQRQELKRRGDEEILVANATLSKLQELGAVRVVASPRLSISRNDNLQDVSRSDQSITSGFIVVAPENRGDLMTHAAALPGVQLIPGSDGSPDRLSIFGLSGDQNNMTMNGVPFGGTRLPREASTALQLRTGYDVSTGGASGATIAIIPTGGSNQIERRFSVLATAPPVQLAGPLGSASQFSAFSISGRAIGPLKWDKNFYSMSFQIDRREQAQANLTTVNDDVLLAVGVSGDSLRSLLGARQNANISYNNVGTVTAANTGSFLGTYDWAPKSAASGHALSLTTSAGFQKRGPNAISLLSTPSSLRSGASVDGTVQLRHSNFFGSGMLTESVIGISGRRLTTTPTARAPSAVVVVKSLLDDSTITTRGLNVGGGGTGGASNGGMILSARNMLSRISDNNQHRIKLTTELSVFVANSREQQNDIGAFTFQSIEDLAVSKPSSFVRNVGNSGVTSRSILGGLALGDSWRPTATLQLQYGLRAEATKFLTNPIRNSSLEEVFSVRNDRLPNRLYLSPRAGFSKTLLDSYTFVRGADYDYTTANSTLSGGIGVFRNTRGSELVSPAILQTGARSGLVTVRCVGSATPMPSWDLYLDSDSKLPSQCANSALESLSLSAPDVTFFARNFVEPQSIRASLRYYSERIPRHRTTVTANFAYNLNQTSYSDINLRTVREFSLPYEGNRSVFIRRSSIDENSGIASISGNRVSSRVGQVREIRSNLRSQFFSLSVDDVLIDFGQRTGLSVGYSYSHGREQFSGFASSSGDPLQISESPLAIPAHDFRATLRYRLGDIASVALFSRLRSGSRFSPMVAGDINGDGNASNDRAFIFDKSSGINGIDELVSHGSTRLRNCLNSQVARVASRNSCTLPWSLGGSLLALAINPTKLGLPARTELKLTLSNPVGALDLLMHGGSNLRGWAQSPVVDENLLVVRGFDRLNSRFIYDVNQRFGAPRGPALQSPTPATLTAEIRFDAAPGLAWQSFNQALQRGRKRTGQKMTESALRSLGAPGGTISPINLSYFLRVTDQLKLTRIQADSIARVVYRFNRLVDSVWAPEAKRAATLANSFDQIERRKAFVAARNAVFDYWMNVMPDIRSLLTRGQIQSINPTMRERLFSENYLLRQRSQFNSFSLYAVP